MSEIRNELLIIRNLQKEIEKNGDIEFQLEYLLERFEIDLESKKKDLEYQLQEINKNLKTLEIVKSEVTK